MASVTGGSAGHSLAWERFHAAHGALLARRRAQGGAPTLGDEHDGALLAALALLPPDAAPRARACGEALGAEVYARPFFEDLLPGAIGLLSASLARSGVGPVRLAEHFHRSALVEHAPAQAAARTHPEVRAALIEGILVGFLGSAFNCRAAATAAAPERYRVELLEGRDVNRPGASG